MKATLHVKEYPSGSKVPKKWIALAENGRRCIGVSPNAAWQALRRMVGEVEPGDSATRFIVGTIETMAEVGMPVTDEGVS